MKNTVSNSWPARADTFPVESRLDTVIVSSLSQDKIIPFFNEDSHMRNIVSRIMKIGTLMLLLFSSLFLSGCVLPCNSTRCVDDVGLRFYVAKPESAECVTTQQGPYYVCMTNEYRRIVTLGPIYEIGRAMDMKRYVFLGETEKRIRITNRELQEVDPSDLGDESQKQKCLLPPEFYDYRGQVRPVLSRKWYGYPAKGLFVLSVPVDIVANITILPGCIIMMVSP